MIESNHKKAAFLREVTRSLTLTNVNVIAERAETVSAQADVVTLRAVERFETILPQALRFLAPGAKLALLIGESQVPHLSHPHPKLAAPNKHSPDPIKGVGDWYTRLKVGRIRLGAPLLDSITSIIRMNSKQSGNLCRSRCEILVGMFHVKHCFGALHSSAMGPGDCDLCFT